MSGISGNIPKSKLLINGMLVDSELRQSVWNPATDEIFANVPCATLGMIDEAVSGAKSALLTWRKDQSLRRICLKRMAESVMENQDQLAQLLSQEIGVPLKQTRDEVAGAAMFLNYRAECELPVDVIHDNERQRVEVRRSPIGIVGAIIPWNAPLLITCEKVGAAFAAGNTVIVKPSPLAPLAVMALGRLWSEIIPAGVLSILQGDAALGEAMVRHPNIGMISFTGSTATGSAIMATGAASLKRLSLELGGNDAAIVLPDVDIEKVAEKIFGGAFYRCGQVCAAIKRVYVHQDIVDEFSQAIAAVAAASKVSGPFEGDVVIGPLSNRQQFDIVCELAEKSVQQGAKILSGGKKLDRAGYFFAPTIVSGLRHDAPLVVREQFGPILPILSYIDIDDAIGFSNSTEYGLGASVWTSNLDEGWRIASELDAGSVWVNRHGLVLPDTPFGGMKMSGIGRSNGAVGLDSYCELKTISMARPR